MKPLFTIGIPTYNRASFLKETLARTLAQTSDRVEIVISDNGSTDDTPRVVAEAGGGDRLRYFRNDSNIGPFPNFQRVLELARGEYFSFLQDDDLIAAEFAQRACRAFEACPSAGVYTCFTLGSHSPHVVYQPAIWGPPMGLDWVRGTPSTLDGGVAAALSLFFTLGLPPTLAFRTKRLREFFPATEGVGYMLWERIILVQGCLDGELVVDPWLGGMHIQHAEQYSFSNKSNEEFYRGWVAFAPLVGEVLKRHRFPWREKLAALLEETPLVHRVLWRSTNGWWPEGEAFAPAHEVRAILDRSLEKSGYRGSPERHPLKDLAHNLTPPLVWGLFKKVLKP